MRLLNRMKANVVRVATLLLIASPFPHAGAADQLTVVEDGAAQMPIVVAPDALTKTRQAAEELATYVQKISGARPALIEGEPGEVPDHATWIGYQPVLDELFPELSFEFEHPEEILIAVNEGHVAIVGRDRWIENQLVVEGRNWTIEGKQQEYGTANAVYTFIHDHLGVRWLWPGESGEDVIERDTIAFKPFTYRYHPQVRERSGLMRLSDRGDSRGLSHDWVRRQRLQLDSWEMEVGGHAFTDWWERFRDDHPDYFALQPNGKRDGFPSPAKVKLCQSNPAVWDQWLNDVQRQLEADPGKTIFSGSPNDSYNRGICICDDCRAWDHLEGEPRAYSWEGISQQYVAMSDRYVTFANKLAERLVARYPDQDYYVRGGAGYGHSQPVAVEARPRDNVIISYVAHFPWMANEQAQREKQQWQGWADRAHTMFYRPNTGSRAGWHQALPEVLMAETIEDFKLLAAHNWRGIGIDTVWEHWATQGPQYYLMAQLAWNPEQDGHAILKDYYQRGFGPAAESIEAYWTLMERAIRKHVEQGGGAARIHKTFTHDVLSEAEALLDNAAASVEDEPAKYGERIAFVRLGYNWTRLLIETRALVERVEQTDGADTEAAEQARANWKELDRIAQAHPKAFKYSLLRNPASNPRLTGFHPDNLR